MSFDLLTGKFLSMAIAFDMAIVSLSRACPFYEGRVAGKAMRTIHYRGSKRFAGEGVYTNLQSVGGLMPYAETVEDLTQQLFIVTVAIILKKKYII
ncbi:MAG: hypothetical protein AAGE84_00735 [Cyanobacteria bacterium P01_G01_bin.39]